MSRLKLFIPLVLFLLMTAVFAVVLKSGYDPKELPSALVGQPLPAFNLPTIESDEIVTEKDLLGDVYLLNVWATWCISCRVEHPHLNQIAKQGVKIVGLDYKDDRPQAKTWLEKLGNPYALNLFDEQGRLGLDLGVYGAPETFMVDKQGIVRYKHVGVVDDTVWQEKLKPVYDKLAAQ